MRSVPIVNVDSQPAVDRCRNAHARAATFRIIRFIKVLSDYSYMQRCIYTKAVTRGVFWVFEHPPPEISGKNWTHKTRSTISH